MGTFLAVASVLVAILSFLIAREEHRDRKEMLRLGPEGSRRTVAGRMMVVATVTEKGAAPSPVTGELASYLRYELWWREGKRTWTGSLGDVIYARDAQGEIEIHTEHADVRFTLEEPRSVSTLAVGDIPEALRPAPSDGKLPRKGEIQYSEQRLEPGELVTVFGRVRRRGAGGPYRGGEGLLVMRGEVGRRLIVTDGDFQTALQEMRSRLYFALGFGAFLLVLAPIFFYGC